MKKVVFAGVCCFFILSVAFAADAMEVVKDKLTINGDIKVWADVNF